MAEVHLALRALLNFDRIDSYSTGRWGEKVAARYLADLHAGMKWLEGSPGLLLKKVDRSLRLRFYQVREHMLVCDVVGDRAYLLCLIYGGMALPNRIAEFEPQLVAKAEVLHRQLGAGEWCAWKNWQMDCNFAGFVRSMTCSRSFWVGGFLEDLGGIRAGGFFLQYPFGTRVRPR